MEGNGPIQGVSKTAGVLIAGDDPVAVDSTCARIMGLAPEKIDHIARAATFLGHIETQKIRQLGESIASTRTPFAVLEAFRHLRQEAA